MRFLIKERFSYIDIFCLSVAQAIASGGHFWAALSVVAFGAIASVMIEVYSK